MDEVLLKLYGSILCRMKPTYSVVYHRKKLEPCLGSSFSFHKVYKLKAQEVVSEESSR